MAKISLFIRFKMLTLWNKIGALGSLASIVGLFLFFVPLIFNKANDPVVTSDLYIKSARFRPMETFFLRPVEGEVNDFFETAFLYITVLNLGDSDLFLTSMEVADVDSKGILSNAYSSSGLGPDISKNTPVRIPAGKEVELSFSGGFKFNGMVDLFDLDRLSKEPYFSDLSPRISLRNDLVEEFNEILVSLFSGQANIRVAFYVGNENLLTEHDFTITKGVDIFDNTGKVQHSYFLGDLIHWLRSPYSEYVLTK